MTWLISLLERLGIWSLISMLLFGASMGCLRSRADIMQSMMDHATGIVEGAVHVAGLGYDTGELCVVLGKDAIDFTGLLSLIPTQPPAVSDDGPDT